MAVRLDNAMHARSTPAHVRVLLVDDDPATARLTMEALRNDNSAPDLFLVNTGWAALQFLRHEGSFERAPRPDIVLLDLNLPQKSGIEVLRDIKNEPSLRDIPIIVFSTSEARSDISNSYRLYANCYVTKPVDFEDFLGTVHNIAEFWLHTAKLPLQ